MKQLFKINFLLYFQFDETNWHQLIRHFDHLLFKFNNKDNRDREHVLNLSMYLYLQILSLMLTYSRTSLKIELLTNAEVLHYTEAKYFFLIPLNIQWIHTE